MSNAGSGSGPRKPHRFAKAVSPPTEKPATIGPIIFKANGSNFGSARDALAKHCLATFGDVSTFLTTGRPVVRPRPTPISVIAEYPDRDGYTNNSRSKVLLSLLSDHRAQLRMDKDASAKMFGVLQQLLEEEGLERVKAHPQWAAASASTSASELWSIISSVHTTHISNVTPSEAKFNALQRFSRCVQTQNMSLTQYREAINTAVAVLSSLNHPHTPDDAAQARHMVHGLDKLRYGEYVADTLNAERRNPDTFPVNIQAVVDGARTFIPTSMVHKAQANVLAFTTHIEGASNTRTKGCHRCGALDHWKRDCPVKADDAPATNASPKAKDQGDKSAHVAESKPKAASKSKKGKPKRAFATSISPDENCFWDEVFHTFSLSLHIAKGSIKSVASPVRKQVRFSLDDDMGVNISATKIRHSRIMSLDTLADHSFTNNMDLIVNPQDRSFKIVGATGSGVGSVIGTLPGFGDIAYTPNSNASGISMSSVTSRYRVDFIPEVAFLVHVSDNLTISFDYDRDTKAYSCMFDDELLSKLSAKDPRQLEALPVTVNQIEQQYAKREVLRAKEAQSLSNKLYSPPAAALASLISSGDVLNCEITGKDVALSDTLYGNAPYLKGRSKFKGPTAARDVLVPTMKRKEQVVYADIMYWHGLPFIVFVCKPLMLVLTQYISGAQSLPAMKDAFLILCNKLQARGYSISSIVVDPQSSLAALANRIPYVVDVIGTGTHVADAEVEIRLLKEKLRSKESQLHWPMPKRVVRWFVYGATSVTNMFRRKGATHCPRTEFTGIKLDYKRDLRSEPGEYCEVNIASGTAASSKENERTVAAVSLCGSGNSRGSQWFLDLKTMNPFLGDRWTVLPTPEWVIDRMKFIHDLDEAAFQKRRPVKLKSGVQSSEQPPVAETQQLKDVVTLPSERQSVDIDADGAIAPAGLDHGVPPMAAVSIPLEETAAPETVANVEDTDESTEALEDDGSSDEIENVTDPYVHLEPVPDTPTPMLGARVIAGQRKSLRIERRLSANGIELKTIRAYKMSIAKAMKKNEHATKKAILAELQQMLSKDVWELVDRSKLTKKQLRGIIRSSLFLKDKFDASGNFIKSKARLVAGGDGQDKSIYEQLSSPTVTHESVMMILAIAAVQKRDIATIDITGAYLECDMPETDEVIMELSPILSRFLAELDPSATEYTDDSGKVLVKLNKALYGCVQSALLWYNKLKSVLVEDGFVQNDYDACVFNKSVNDVQVTVAFHVDDLLVTSVLPELVTGVADMLKNNFEAVTVTRGPRHSYLAMNLVVTESGIDIDMIAYIEKVLEGRTLNTSKVFTPATEDLFKASESEPALGAEEAKSFHSDVAKLLYVAKRTRLEILLCVSQLASKVATPTQGDQKNLWRLFDYLSTTKGAILHMSANGEVKMEAYIDASFGIHEDATSRTGVVLQMAGVGIAGWTGKQKLVTKSSTEAEVVALSDGLTHVLWAREFLTAQGHDVTPLVVYQDNQSVLSLMQTGRSNKHRTKHLNVRYFFAKDRADCGDIALKYMPTGNMLADLLTKPVVGETFKKLVKQLYGHKAS